MEKITYYIKLQRFSLWNAYYAFMDTAEYFADGLFIKHQVSVHFGREYVRPPNPYHIIFCRVHKKDEERFLEALDEMPNKMILCGYPDYLKDCETLWKEIIDNAEENERKRFCRTGNAVEEAQ